MEHRILKHWPVMLIISVMGLSFYALGLAMRASSAPTPATPISYEMPRPRSAEMAYDLSRRQVVRNIRSLPESPSPVAANGAGTVQTPQGDAAKKAEDAKKKKAQAAAAAKKKADAAKKAALEKRKARLQVILMEQEKSRMKGFEKSKTDTEPVAAAGQLAGGIPAEIVDSNEEDNLKLSVAQWRARLFGQPTAKNGIDFVSAFLKGEIDEKSFYQITEELLVDSVQHRQQLALSILQQVPSVKTFTLLTAHYQDKTPEVLKKGIYDVIKTYGEASRFSVLARLLESKDKRVAQLASQLLEKALTAQNQTGQGTTTGRDQRGPGSAPIPAAQFQTFVPVLQRLSSSGDGSLAQQAQSLLTQIQALQPASA